MKLSDLPRLKELGLIVDYRIEGNDVYISPRISVNFIKLDIVVTSDGDVLASTGKDIRADNSIGD